MKRPKLNDPKWNKAHKFRGLFQHRCKVSSGLEVWSFVVTYVGQWLIVWATQMFKLNAPLMDAFGHKPM